MGLSKFQQLLHDDSDSSEQGLPDKPAKRTRHAEMEVLYPQPTVAWYPNIERHPSFTDALSPLGFQPVSLQPPRDKVQPDGGLHASRISTGTGGAVAVSSRPNGQTPAQVCQVGDVVDVFSRSAGRWLRCEVAKVEGNSLVIHTESHPEICPHGSYPIEITAKSDV